MSKPMPAPWPHMLVCFELEGDVYTDKVTAARADEEGNTVFAVAQHPGWRIDWTPWAVREVRSSSGAVLWRRDPPALPAELPEVWPGMKVEYTPYTGAPRRRAIVHHTTDTPPSATLVTVDGARFYWREADPEEGDTHTIYEVRSANNEVLWKRPT